MDERIPKLKAAKAVGSKLLVHTLYERFPLISTCLSTRANKGSKFVVAILALWGLLAGGSLACGGLHKGNISSHGISETTMNECSHPGKCAYCDFLDISGIYY